MGGFLWSEIQAYLQTQNGPPPKVTCTFCTRELIVEGLQPPSDDREPAKILPCGHIFGQRCINRWIDMNTWFDEADGQSTARCPICRRSASSGREQPHLPMLRGEPPPTPEDPQILGRRRRPDTSVSVSRPPQQRMRLESPDDDVMIDADDDFGAQPDQQPGQMSPRPPESPPGGPPGGPPGPRHGQGRRIQKEIIVQDPEVRNDQGGFKEAAALLISGLARRGWIAVELPSRNDQFPDCPRRYSMKCKDYKIKWGALYPLQRKCDLPRLKQIAKSESQRAGGYWVPEMVGIISSPQYTTEVQANPFHVLLLRLPDGDKGYNKTNAFAAFGDLTDGMEEYWFRSGQKEPSKPREIHHREHLQHLGVQHGGEGTLLEVDNALRALTARLSNQTSMLGRERLAGQRHPEGSDLEADAEAERGRSRTRRA